MRRVALVVVATVFFSLLPAVPASAAAQPAPQAGAAGIGDPYFPLDGNGGYDVRHYGLKLRYAPSTDVLRGAATIRARALESLNRFDLDLVGLTVDSVRVNGRKATWSRRGQELRITPAKVLRRHRDFTVKVRYHGVPKIVEISSLGRGGVFPTADGALVIGQPHSAATWFPVNDHPSDKATYTIAVTVPRGLEAVSNGRLARVRRHHRTATWTWVERAPMASYLATATVGQFNLKSSKRKGISYLDAIDPVLYRKPAPRSGQQFAVSQSDDNAYKRLTHTFTVPASGGRLSFSVLRNTEPGWDFFAVEAHSVGADDWTTLPDLNGHSSTDFGVSCPSWWDIHPFLTHYQSPDEEEGCAPTGTTGRWNAASGASDGYERWSVDLGAYAGRRVEVSLSVISDEVTAYPGAYVDDIVGPGGLGSTSFENDGNTSDGWRVPGPPAGSPGNAGDWLVTNRDPEPSVGQNAQAALAKEPEVLDFLSGVLGPYPFRQAGGIVDDDPDLGYALENQTRPIYSTAFFHTDDEANDAVVLHELAHQWTGDNLAVGRWRDIWLNEGFATYMEWLWSEKQGRGTADQLFAGWSSIPADDSFWELRIGDPGAEQLFDAPVYYRGALTLHALRQTIGDDAFFTLLKRWTAKYAGGNVSTEQFVALAEQVSGRQLDAFFQTWLYTPTKPAGLDVASTARVRAAAAPHLVKQREHLTARR